MDVARHHGGRRRSLSNGRKTALALVAMVAVASAAALELTRLGSTSAPPAGRSLPAELAPVSTTSARRPSPTPALPVATTAGRVQYVVAPGDTVTSIARRFGVTAAAVIAANGLTDPDHLAAGATLVVPPPPPVELTVSPASVAGGQPVQFELRGARPGEAVTFAVTVDGATYTGPPHVAADDGTVSATYTPDLVSDPHADTVTASGDQGTHAEATLSVTP